MHMYVYLYILNSSLILKVFTQKYSDFQFSVDSPQEKPF